MKFDGKVQFRSSMQPGTGPPGEAEVQHLNPQRVAKILQVTGWGVLEPGSLNLTVTENVVDALLNYKPTLTEDGSSVKYPLKYQNIPVHRKAYYYYSAVARVGGKQQPVLVRRAQNPVRGRVELFGEINLTNYFGVTDGDVVTVEIR